MTRSSLAKAMEDAALTDLRGEDVLPELLQIINSGPVTDPQEAQGLQWLSAWKAAGTKRKEVTAGSHTYADADAVRVMDAWWPLLIQGEFQSGLGSDLYNALAANLSIDESPSAGHGPTGSHAGSSFQYGWWSYADKDLRKVLGKPVQGPLAQTYCGGGHLAACRRHAAVHPPAGGGRPGHHRLPRATTAAARPATSGARTASCSGRWAGSPRPHLLAEPPDVPAGRGVPEPPPRQGWRAASPPAPPRTA